MATEIGAWDWGLIYPELQRLELRGEVRRGYFVQGLPGMQFALSEVVERLCEANAISYSQDELVVLNACDAANLYGATGETAPTMSSGAPLSFARIPSNWLVLGGGLPVLLMENSGAEMSTTAL